MTTQRSLNLVRSCRVSKADFLALLTSRQSLTRCDDRERQLLGLVDTAGTWFFLHRHALEGTCMDAAETDIMPHPIPRMDLSGLHRS